MLVMPQSPHVILITIDGVRWQEIYNGSDGLRTSAPYQTSRQLAPNLYHSFVDQGIAIGKSLPVIATGPNHVSLPGYLEITRGHPSADCQDNQCNPTIDQSIFWFFKNPAVFSCWPTIIKVIPPNENIVTDIPINYRIDSSTELAAIYYLNNHNPDLLWISLGDTDENGHKNNYSRYIESLQMADTFIGYLVSKYPNTTFIITTDHGRSNNFTSHGKDKESERVWLMMRGPNIPNLGFVLTGSVSLSNIFYTITDVEFGSRSSNSIMSRLNDQSQNH